jgi:hypothetical protein
VHECVRSDPCKLYVRTYSGEFPNIYNLVHYACCREIFNKNSHKLIKNLQQAKQDNQPNLSDDEESKNRGVCLAEKLQPIENFTQLFGCPPGFGILGDSKFTVDIINLFRTNSHITGNYIDIPMVYN